jgi:hypothetical protein
MALFDSSAGDSSVQEFYDSPCPRTDRCRDRNRLGMLSDLLGAAAMGLRNLLHHRRPAEDGPVCEAITHDSGAWRSRAREGAGRGPCARSTIRMHRPDGGDMLLHARLQFYHSACRSVCRQVPARGISACYGWHVCCTQRRPTHD